MGLLYERAAVEFRKDIAENKPSRFAEAPDTAERGKPAVSRK